MGHDDLDKFDSFEFVSNTDLEDAYYQCVRENDPDLIWLEKEMEKRGLLGRC